MTFSGLLSGVVNQKQLVRRLLSPAGKRFTHSFFGTGSDPHAVWTAGGCLFLATALAHIHKAQVLLFDDEDNWHHAALLLSDGSVMDADRHVTSVKKMVAYWPETVGTRIISADMALKALESDEQRRLPELIALLKGES